MHVAPLVQRLDRFSAHQTDEVRNVLDAWGVLLLHGPAYYSRYYGQLERQNREHRAWLDVLGEVTPYELDVAVDRMRAAWNSRLPRRILDWMCGTRDLCSTSTARSCATRCSHAPTDYALTTSTKRS